MFCGFNKDMLKGLELFHKGLVDNKIIDKFNDKRYKCLKREKLFKNWLKMALCGFNKEMLKGLKEFHVGLIKQKTPKESEENKDHLEEN